jgi:phage tail tape-measure protein
MGFGDFLKSAAGAVGSVGGSLLGGPLGGAIGGMMGGSISQAHQDKKQFERNKYWHDQQVAHQEKFAKKTSYMRK